MMSHYVSLAFSNLLFVDNNLLILTYDKSQLTFKNLGISLSLHFGRIFECSSLKKELGIQEFPKQKFLEF